MGTTYSNTGLTASTTHYYVVVAVDADGTSGASAQASAETSASCQRCPIRPNRTNRDGVFFFCHRPELDGSNSASELHDQLLQRLWQHCERVYSLCKQPDFEQWNNHNLFEHRP